MFWIDGIELEIRRHGEVAESYEWQGLMLSQQLIRMYEHYKSRT